MINVSYKFTRTVVSALKWLATKFDNKLALSVFFCHAGVGTQTCQTNWTRRERCETEGPVTGNCGRQGATHGDDCPWDKALLCWRRMGCQLWEMDTFFVSSFFRSKLLHLWSWPFPLCSQVNVIHTANPVEHANHIAAQPQFVHPVHHTFVDLSGHNLANPHPFSGKDSQSLLFSWFFPGLKCHRSFLLQGDFFPKFKPVCWSNTQSRGLVLLCCCPGREGEVHF